MAERRQFLYALLVIALATAGARAAANQQVAAVCRTHGIAGGLIVHVGCADGRGTAALRSSPNFRVHGLDTGAAAIVKARAHLRGLGVYGDVSVDTFDGLRLPYADNMVNLIVVSGESSRVPEAELLRVLVPRGVAMAGGRVLVKPRPEDTDEWTHYFHDASGNAVSADRRVAPFRHLQWDGGPRWSRSHETDMSLTAAVTANGRIFHTLDEGPIGIHESPRTTRRFPDKCSLVARDAFNGVTLWKRAMPGWGSAAWDANRWRFGKRDQMWSSPLTLPRRLVAAGDRLYVTLGFRACVSELDAVRGETLREFKETDRTEEIVMSDGVLVLRLRDKPGNDVIVAMEAASGRILWRHPAGDVADLTMAASAERVCHYSKAGLIALDLRTGDKLWQAPAARKQGRGSPACTLVMHGDVVLLAWPGSVQALSADNGRVLWTGKTAGSFRGPPDVFVANGLAWVGTLTTRGLDLKTGTPRKQISPGSLFTGGHHARCHRARATEGFVLFSKRGIEFLDLEGDGHMRHDWVRGTCRYGIIPANGLMYAPSHSCFCYPGVKLSGFNALSASDGSVSSKRRRQRQLVRGPAYGAVDDAGPSSAADWPTYRHDNARSGGVRAPVPPRLTRAWRTPLRGKVSPPVVAAGRLFVAGLDSHTVHCLDAGDGGERWTFVAGGPVDSPPTVSKDRVLFGCRDGSVYSLRASDGQVAWRFHAAPFDKRIMSYGRLESAWPVHGSVLVEGETVYFAAGRSSFLDGGIYLYGLDVATGDIRHRARLDGPWPDLSKPSNRAHDMDGSLNDILVGSGQKLFLTQNVFDLGLEQLPAPRIAPYGARKTDLRLVATGGFLDDSMFDRNFWMHARRWPGLYVAVDAPKAGQILVFDETTTYGLHVFTTKFSRSPYFDPASGGYELFADDNSNEPVLDEKNARRERGTMTRSRPPKWSVRVPVLARAMVLAGDSLFLAGPPDVVDAKDPLGALEGRKGALLWVVSAADGSRAAEYRLDVPPVFDGMIAANRKLYITTTDGAVSCWK